jgi:glycosyltransferase involved in cell wall biosynthesis
MSAPKLLFLATEDWFVASHFLPLVRGAQGAGFDVAVAARDSGALESVRVIDTPFARGSLKPWEVSKQVAHLRALLESERPDIVHAIALKPIALLIMSGYRGAARVLAVTGRGYLGVGRAPWTRLVAWRLQRMLRAALREPKTLLLVENEADARWVGVGQSMPMPGAGVDPDQFTIAAEPASPPIVVGVVTRLVRSKGVDLAVAAIRHLRESGEDIVLRIAGAADAENPEHVPAAEIERWRATPGVELVGRTSDVSGFWAGAHIACLPSRGGEGLPRSLLEAAACGRPIVTSDAPGCADFVKTDIGVVAPRDDATALSAALLRLARDGDVRTTMGAAARAKIIASYSEQHAADAALAAWRRVLAGG